MVQEATEPPVSILTVGVKWVKEFQHALPVPNITHRLTGPAPAVDEPQLYGHELHTLPEVRGSAPNASFPQQMNP